MPRAEPYRGFNHLIMAAIAEADGDQQQHQAKSDGAHGQECAPRVPPDVSPCNPKKDSHNISAFRWCG